MTLVLGGARSGKSALSQSIAEQNQNKKSQKDLFYIATATANDEEMQQRIQHHQTQRCERWTLCEEPLYLADTLRQHDHPDRCLLVDCLTLWVTNLITHTDENLHRIEFDKLEAILPTLKADIIMVSNEVGLGIIPMGKLSRQFCDETGRLHQSLAALSDNVIMTIAGLPQYLKGSASTLS